MKNSEILSRFNFAIETKNKEVALFLYDLLKENANEAIAQNLENASDVVYDAQVARVALRIHGAGDEVFEGCNF